MSPSPGFIFCSLLHSPSLPPPTPSWKNIANYQGFLYPGTSLARVPITPSMQTLGTLVGTGEAGILPRLRIPIQEETWTQGHWWL